WEGGAVFRPADPPEHRLDKWEAPFARSTAGFEGGRPLFAALLSPPFGERYPPLALSPTQHRRRTLAALRSIRGSRPPATDPALVRGRELGGCHLPRAPRSDGRAGASTPGPCGVHLPTGVRAALGWSAQR